MVRRIVAAVLAASAFAISGIGVTAAVATPTVALATGHASSNATLIDA
jgi:hypothetical protein